MQKCKAQQRGYQNPSQCRYCTNLPLARRVIHTFLVLYSGADVNISAKHPMRSPLSHALAGTFKAPDVVKWLVRCGANLRRGKEKKL